MNFGPVFRENVSVKHDLVFDKKEYISALRRTQDTNDLAPLSNYLGKLVRIQQVTRGIGIGE